MRQIDTGRNRKYRNRNRRRNCGRMAPMRPGFDHLAAVTVTESAVTVTVREIAAAWGPCGHKIRPLRSCGTPTAWPQLKNFLPHDAAVSCGRMMRPHGCRMGLRSYTISFRHEMRRCLEQRERGNRGHALFPSLPPVQTAVWGSKRVAGIPEGRNQRLGKIIVVGVRGTFALQAWSPLPNTPANGMLQSR